MKKIKQFLALLTAVLSVMMLTVQCEYVESLAKVESYTVKFETNGGGYIASQTIETGAMIEKPVDPTRDGYTFAGWYFNADFTSAWDFATQINDDITLYAKWSLNDQVVEPEDEATYFTVSFESNGGSAVASQSIESDSKVVKPKNPTLAGYDFVDWYSDEALTQVYDFATSVTANITLYAKWLENTVTVSFESNGGSAVVSQSIGLGSKVVEPQKPTLTGYDFVDWYSDEALTQVYDFATPVTANITLYAKWLENTVTVSFESNGGSAVAPQTIKCDTVLFLPAFPTLTGYDFGGWYYDAELSQVYNFYDVITENITLYAKWTLSQYTLTFVSNGGSAVKAQIVDYNTKAKEPDAPTRTKYTFGGWYAEPTFLTKWDFATPITDNTSIYAKWILVEGELPSMGSGDLL